MAVVMVAPSFIEELIFRGLLLRVPDECEPRATTCEAQHEDETARVHSTSEFGSDSGERLASVSESHCTEGNGNSNKDGEKRDPQPDVVGAPLSSAGESTTVDVAGGKLKPMLTPGTPPRHGAHWLCGPYLRCRPPARELAASLALFVVFHLDVIHDHGFFRDPRFLLLALVLGIACQEAAVGSRSLWPSVFMHGFWVWCWFTFFKTDW